MARRGWMKRPMSHPRIVPILVHRLKPRFQAFFDWAQETRGRGRVIVKAAKVFEGLVPFYL